MLYKELSEPKQSGQIGFNLAQIARLPHIGIGDLVRKSFARLGPIWHEKPTGKLARLVISRLEGILCQKPDWPEFQIGARLLWIGQTMYFSHPYDFIRIAPVDHPRGFCPDPSYLGGLTSWCLGYGCCNALNARPEYGYHFLIVRYLGNIGNFVFLIREVYMLGNIYIYMYKKKTKTNPSCTLTPGSFFERPSGKIHFRKTHPPNKSFVVRSCFFFYGNMAITFYFFEKRESK